MEAGITWENQGSSPIYNGGDSTPGNATDQFPLTTSPLSAGTCLNLNNQWWALASRHRLLWRLHKGRRPLLRIMHFNE